jgi:tetratricopeptide (TPR) repeat protein
VSSYDSAAEDIEAAINLLQEALAATLPGFPGWTNTQMNLAMCFAERFEQNNDPNDLNAAITALELCLREAEHGTDQWAMAQDNLCRLLTQRFYLGHQAFNLDAAIQAGYRALTVEGKDSWDSSQTLEALANALWERAELSNNEGDRSEAIKKYEQLISGEQDALPIRRFSAARRIGNLLFERAEWVRASEFLLKCIEAINYLYRTFIGAPHMH